MKCLVLALKNGEDNKDIMETVTFLEASLQEIFQRAEINTLNIAKDEELFRKTLTFSSNTLMIDFIITVGGFDFESECIAMEAMQGVIKQPNDVLLQCLDTLLPDTFHQFNYGILDGTLIFNFPGRLDFVTEYYTACKAVLPQVLKLVKKSSIITQELAPNEEETMYHDRNQLKSKVDISKIKNSTLDDNLGLEAALKVIFETSHDLNRQIEYRSIKNILGSVLANNVIAPEDIPSVSISNVVGFAFITIDKDIEVKWPLIELEHGKECPSSTFVSVSIGDTIPSGADRVVKKEDCKINGNQITCKYVHERYNTKNYIKNAGIGVLKNQIIIYKGTLIGPFEKGLLAHLKIKLLPVYSKPRVSSFSIEGCQEGKVESLLDSVTIKETQLSLLGELNIMIQDMGLIELDPDRIKTTLEEAFRRSDVIIVATQKLCSPDKYILEYVLLEDFQASIHFTRLEINQNAPTIFATCIFNGKPKLIFGLPGNPVLEFVTYNLIILPSLMSFMGAKHEKLNTDSITPNNTFNTLISKQLENAMTSTKDSKWFKDVISSCKVFPN